MQNGNAAGKFGQTFLKFLAVVVACGLFDLCLDLSHACCDGFFRTCTVNDGGVLFIDLDLVGAAEHVDGRRFELHAFFFRHYNTAGQDGDIFKHLFAAVAEAGSLDGADLQRTTQTVHNECCQCFLINILGDDQQRTSALCACFENRKQILEVGNLFVVDQDVGRFILALHLLCIGHEIGRDIAAVELHAFNGVDGGLGALGLVDGDDTLFLYGLHRFGDQSADSLVVVG